jgi:hypothetical protein
MSLRSLYGDCGSGDEVRRPGRVGGPRAADSRSRPGRGSGGRAGDRRQPVRSEVLQRRVRQGPRQPADPPRWGSGRHHHRARRRRRWAGRADPGRRRGHRVSRVRGLCERADCPGVLDRAEADRARLGRGRWTDDHRRDRLPPAHRDRHEGRRHRADPWWIRRSRADGGPARHRPGSPGNRHGECVPA